MRLSCLAPLLLLTAPIHAQLPAGTPPHPPGNPPTAAKVLLGKALFWEEQLSTTNTVACGTCHNPGAGFSDPRTRLGGQGVHFAGRDMQLFTEDDVLGSPGVVRNLPGGEYERDAIHGLRALVTKRKAPSVVDAAYSPLLLTTGDMTPVFTSPITGKVVLDQNATLESQALQPLLHPIEMGHDGRTWTQVVDKLTNARPLALATDLGQELGTFVGGRSYPMLFKRTFGTSEITPERIAMAIASYERTLVSGVAPIDQFLAGDTSALSLQERQGWAVFNAPNTNCITCHPGPRFTDDDFHYLGVRPIIESRGRFYVTLDTNDLGKFRTPSLRNVALRAPYFHQGGTGDLAGVVAFFDRGGDFDGPTKSTLVHPLGLSAAEKAALVAFLGRPLTDPRLATGLAPFDRPKLASENGRLPQTFGSASAGSGGFQPHMIAVEAPLVGGDHVTVSVERALGGASAFLALDTQASSGLPFHGATSWLAHSGALITIPVGALQGVGAGQGWGSRVIQLPSDPGLVGTHLYAQWFVLDPGSSGTYAASRAVRFELF